MKSTGNEVAIMKDLRLHEGELNVMELLEYLEEVKNILAGRKIQLIQ